MYINREKKRIHFLLFKEIDGELYHYEGGNMFNNEIPLIIVCDEKEVKYADYLIQLISEKKENTLSVSATIFTDKQYKDNLPQISSQQHILFIGSSQELKNQKITIKDKYSHLGMHYGWLGKRCVLYCDNVTVKWYKKEYDDFLSYRIKCGLAEEIDWKNGEVNKDIAKLIGKGMLEWGLTPVTKDEIREHLGKDFPYYFLVRGTYFLFSGTWVTGKNVYKKAIVFPAIQQQRYNVLEKVFMKNDFYNFMEE